MLSMFIVVVIVIFITAVVNIGLLLPLSCRFQCIVVGIILSFAFIVVFVPILDRLHALVTFRDGWNVVGFSRLHWICIERGCQHFSTAEGGGNVK